MKLIDADELLSIVRSMTVVDKSVMHRILIQMPTVDAVPVRHGRWECSDHYENAVCSECGYDTGKAWGFGYGRGCYKFCPNCGADMRKDGDGNG